MPFNGVAIDSKGVLRMRAPELVKVSSKYQVVIPRAIRQALGIEPGQRLHALLYDGRVELVPIRPIKQMRGSLKGIDTAVERDEDRV
jgi:AbrB family looped-hinge helix DNA binding protein